MKRRCSSWDDPFIVPTEKRLTEIFLNNRMVPVSVEFKWSLMNTETSGLLSLNSQATCTEKFVRDDRYVGVCASELWNYCSGLVLILFTTLERVSLASTVLG